MSNVDPKLASFKARLLNLETEKRARSEDIADLKKEAKSAGLSKEEIAGFVLAVRREFETADKKASRTAAEEVADMLAASGDAPLFGRAA
jgi:uncharacterized protein (UPF0335 family)